MSLANYRTTVKICGSWSFWAFALALLDVFLMLRGGLVGRSIPSSIQYCKVGFLSTGYFRGIPDGLHPGTHGPRRLRGIGTRPFLDYDARSGLHDAPTGLRTLQVSRHGCRHVQRAWRVAAEEGLVLFGLDREDFHPVSGYGRFRHRIVFALSRYGSYIGMK